MDLASKKFVKNLLKGKGIRPSRRMGQNFLISKKVLKKIIESSNLKPRDIILEIGPGIGTITKELAQKVKKVIAIEKDPRMIEILKETLMDFKNVEIIQGDILKFSIFSKEPGSRAIGNFQFSKIISNLPHNIATEVIRKFLETKNPPELMVVLVQKEVGKRICSQPPKMERLGVLVQARANIKILEIVKKTSFWPQPKVDSVILKIVPRRFRVPVSRKFREQFVRIVKAGFSHPRKQLINNFSQGLNLSREKVEKWLLKSNIAPTQRAESLSLENWLNLTKTFK